MILDKPKISWHVLEEYSAEDYEYIQCKTYNEEGSYVPGERIYKTIQIWNNCNGNNDVLDANDCVLVFAFKNFEDNVLLNLIDVQVDNMPSTTLEVDIDRGIIGIGNLSGIANNGSALNSNNYKTIHFSIGPIPANIKSELKSMYLYLEYISE